MPLPELNAKSFNEVVGWRLLRYQQKLAGVPSAPFTSIIIGSVGTTQASNPAIFDFDHLYNEFMCPISHITAY